MKLGISESYHQTKSESTYRSASNDKRLCLDARGRHARESSSLDPHEGQETSGVDGLMLIRLRRSLNFPRDERLIACPGVTEISLNQRQERSEGVSRMFIAEPFDEGRLYHEGNRSHASTT